MRGAARIGVALALAAGLAGVGLLAALRPPQPTVPPRGAVLDGVTLVQPGEGRLASRRLRIEGDRIAAVEADSGDASGPFAGAFVLPGLVDLHVHHPPPIAVGERELFAALFLRHGVTTVRDVGGAWPGTLRAHAARIRAGATPGPRIAACGPFLDGDPPDWPAARVVRDAAEARRAVEALHREGADCVKLYNNLAPPVVAALQDAAARAGLPVVAHVPWALPLDRLHDAEVQHGMGLAGLRGGPPPDARAIADYVRTSRRRRLRHTPTLVAFARAAQLEEGRLPATPAARLLPLYYRRTLWDPERNALARAQIWRAGRRLAILRQQVAALHAAGLPILAGTDTMSPGVVPGAALHEELRLLAEAGLGVEGAWRAATSRAGEALGMPGLGRLEAGAPADLLVFREDPSRDLAGLATLEAVVADGRLYRRDALEDATARLAEPLRRAPYEPLSSAAASALVSWLGRGS